MGNKESKKYTIPNAMRNYIKDQGYAEPYSQMEPLIGEWDALLRSEGDFWDSTEVEGELTYKRHRLTVKPFQAVADEFADLIMGDDGTTVTADDEATNEWLQGFISESGFMGQAQDTIADAFGLGTAAWAVSVDTEAGEAQILSYDATMTVPLSWRNGNVTECAFACKTVDEGKGYDQLSMHVKEEDGYHIRTAMWDEVGNRYRPEWLIEDLPTGCMTPTFAVVRPAIQNKHYKFSPYGVPVYDGHEDVLQSVDEAYDAIFGDIRKGKMRMFLSESMIEVRKGKDGKVRSFPFGKDDAEFFKSLDTQDGDVVKEFAPALRTEQQARAYQIACAEMGKACGFGEDYWTIDKNGQLKTATEVVTGNSKLMRTVRRHENKIRKQVQQIMTAVLHVAARYLEATVSPAAAITVKFDDSVMTDTQTEKAADMAEVSAGIMAPWEFRVKWYGEDEATAKANVPAGQAYEPEPFPEE